MWAIRNTTRLLLLLAAGTVVAACELAQLLPAAPGPDCAKVVVEAVLHVDGTDSRLTWGTDLASGNVIKVRPRPDLGWTIDPASHERMLDRRGKVATFEGEIFRQACFLEITDTFFVGPEDLPDPGRPPN
jgi:uncharacterized lipoprotein YajG